MQQIAMGIRALDPRRHHQQTEYAALDKSLSEHKNLRDEKYWLIGREVVLVILAGVGVVFVGEAKIAMGYPGTTFDCLFGYLSGENWRRTLDRPQRTHFLA